MLLRMLSIEIFLGRPVFFLHLSPFFQPFLPQTPSYVVYPGIPRSISSSSLLRNIPNLLGNFLCVILPTWPYNSCYLYVIQPIERSFSFRRLYILLCQIQNLSGIFYHINNVYYYHSFVFLFYVEELRAGDLFYHSTTCYNILGI